MDRSKSLVTSLALRGGIAWATLLSLTPAWAESRYVVDLTEGASSVLQVTLESSCLAFPCDFVLPAWSATYQIRDFSQFIGLVHAETSAAEPLDLRKVAPSRWRVESSPNPKIRLTYKVRADRDGPFGAAVRSDRATMNLAQLLIYAEKQREQPAYLGFTGAPKDFREALALPKNNDAYWAPSYDRLIDTPVLLADFKDSQFEVAGKSIRVVAYGAGAGGRIGALKNAARKIVEAAVSLMGEAPFDEYTFVYVFSERDGGGMEYRDGTLIFGPADCPACGMEELTAHEFFHLWNVKRIRPQSMEPVDFSRPVPSPSLWFAEGISSTYASYLLASAGLATERDLLNRLEDRINQYEARPARLMQSAEESSIDAWLEGNPAYNRPDRSVSYYLKGELIGHLLDLEIRGRTNNRRSLDDVLRRLNQDYALRGLAFDDTQTLIDIATDTAGSDMTSIFDELVRTASPIRWDSYLKHAGLHLESMTATQQDVGFSLADPPGHGVVVSAITVGGSAERAGLRIDDRLLEINGRRVLGGAEAALKQLQSATTANSTMLVEREGLRIALSLKADKQVKVVHRVVSLAQVNETQQLIRDGWLHRTTTAAQER